VTNFKVLFRHLSGKFEEDDANPPPRQPVARSRFERIHPSEMRRITTELNSSKKVSF
jgi:hypothetical protein